MSATKLNSQILREYDIRGINLVDMHDVIGVNFGYKLFLCIFNILIGLSSKGYDLRETIEFIIKLVRERK